MGLDSREGHHRGGGHYTVEQLLVVVLQVEIPHPVVLCDVPGKLQRQGRLAGAGITAQHHQIARFHVDLFVQGGDAPPKVRRLVSVGVAVQELRVGLLQRGDPDAGLAAVEGIDGIHQSQRGVQVTGFRQLAAKLGEMHLQGGPLEDGHVLHHVCGGHSLVDDLRQKLVVVPAQGIVDGESVHGLSIVVQLPNGLIDQPVPPLGKLAVRDGQQDLAHHRRLHQHGAKDPGLGVKGHIGQNSSAAQKNSTPSGSSTVPWLALGISSGSSSHRRPFSQEAG